jgi:hypothetical protein
MSNFRTFTRSAFANFSQRRDGRHFGRGSIGAMN